MEYLKDKSMKVKSESLSPDLTNIHEMFLNMKRAHVNTTSDIPKKSRKLSEFSEASDLRGNENDDLMDDEGDFLDDVLDGGYGDGDDANSVGGRKEPHLVARRNARERRRVQMVNEGFSLLRRQIPTEPKHKKLSKVKIYRLQLGPSLHPPPNCLAGMLTWL